MAEAFMSEIRIFAGTFAPRSWALCNGQMLKVNNFQALYSLLGTIYGGDGRTTFALPDLRGRAPIHWGSGPGLTPRRIAQRIGEETVTLRMDQIPAHNHPMQASTDENNRSPAVGNVPGNFSPNLFYNPGTNPSKIYDFSSDAVGYTGGSEAHDNEMPFLVLNFIICIQGTYPSRN